jgi:hypothetical protein
MSDNKREDLTGFYAPSHEDVEKYKQMRVALLVPCGDYKSHIRWVACMVNAIAYSWRHNLKIDVIAYTERTVVDWARNSLARSFVDSVDPYEGKPYTHALWLDDDHIFNPDMFCRLAAHSELDMVSAVYYQRTSPYHPTAYIKDDTDNEYKHWPLMYIPQDIVEVDAVGFGALLMRREVLEKTPEPWFTLDWRAGEDVAFCKRAKDAGFRIWITGDYRIGHLGRVPVITVADSERHMAENPEEYGDKIKVRLNTPRGADA